MACHTVIAAIAILLVGYTSSQDCTRAALNSGQSNIPHESHCELRWTCLNDLSSVLQYCLHGLLYDQNLQICTWPYAVSCKNWNCSTRITYPSVCDDSYFTCINGNAGFKLEECEAGFVYSGDDFLACTPRTSTGYTEMHMEYCKRNTGTTPTTQVNENAPCETRGNLGTYMKAASHGDPCKYDNYDPYNPTVSTFQDRPCAVGTGFDNISCRCVKNDRCGLNAITPYNPKANDEQCRASMILDFTDGFYAGETKSSNVRMRTTDKVDHTGVRIQRIGSEVYAEFRRGDAREPAYLHMPRFNNNEMRSPMAFTVTFRTDGTTQNFDILRNERDDHCLGLASIWAKAYVNGNVLDVEVEAKGLTDSGVSNSGRMGGTMQLGSINDWIKLTLIMEKSQMRGELRSQGRVGVDLSPGIIIGDKLRRTNCGLEFGHNLSGEMREVVIYEGCGDTSRVNPEP